MVVEEEEEEEPGVVKMKAKGLMVHSRPTEVSEKVYGLPCRKSRSWRAVRVVSSLSSRQAVASGEASLASTLPEMGAYLCLFPHVSSSVTIPYVMFQQTNTDMYVDGEGNR